MEFYEGVRQILGLGLEPKDLNALHICLRGGVVFVATLIMVRLANKRFLAKLSAFDAILALILASMLSRAVNGSSAFFPTLAGGFALVALHHLLAMLSFRSRAFGALVKGTADILVQDGKIDREKMRANNISEQDLLEEARLNGGTLDVAHIHRATMERNGQISVVPMKS